MLAISDEETHQSHFFFRDVTSGGVRSMDRYLRSFGEIRRIQDYLMGRAEKESWPIIDAGDADQALIAVMDLILERATARQPAVP
jgi:2-phosphoglycerate kinase